ncbi:MAG TPA: hypothetical protein EYN06_09285 [Myxococcales bacterium]|nr:hypothetical protein [Myxococcales bacterium]HIN86661.1 hypothetical protein [Myxococcales bacterium]
MRQWSTIAIAFWLLGCMNSGLTNRNGCFSDIDCEVGTSCNSQTHRCEPPSSRTIGKSQDKKDSTSTEPAPGDLCPEGDTCDDGNPCTMGDNCDAEGACVGNDYSCDDGFECTIDLCDGVGGCDYTITAGTCLIHGKCYQSGDSPTDNPCYSCLPSVHEQAWSSNDNNTCDDGDVCTENSPCSGGSCNAGTPIDCNDDDDCTLDDCIPGAGCVYVIDEKHCDDGIACTLDLCDGVGGCSNTPADGDCDDGVECTSELCDLEQGCVVEFSDAVCDDKDDCTTDFCTEAGCEHISVESSECG